MASNVNLKNNLATEGIIYHKDGDPAHSVSIGELANSVKQVDTIADLRLMTNIYSVLLVLGHTTKDDGAYGSDKFYWDATSTDVDNGGTIIKLDNFETGRYKLKYYFLFPEFFGIDGTRENDSIAIRACLDYADGNPMYLKYKRYFYDGTTITNSKVRILGSGMPSINSGKTALENGSIIDGTFGFTSSDAEFINFGVDNGSDSDSAEGDALRTTAPLDAGGHLHTENIVGLGKGNDSPYHALLFQSHLKHTGGNLLGCNAYFGFVSKCQNVDLGLVYSIDNDESGVLLKSDTGFGKCANVSIDRVVCECVSGQRRGFHVQSSSSSLRQVQIGSVKSDGADDNVLIQLGSAGTDIRNLTIESIISRNSQQRDILVDTTSSTGQIFNVEIGTLTTENTNTNGIMVVGNGLTDDINIERAYINYASSASQATMDASCFFGGNCTSSRIGSLTIIKNFNHATRGGVTYNNASGINILGSRICSVYGVGRPQTGVEDVAITSANSSITIPYNESGEDYSFIRLEPTAGSFSVDEFVNPVTGASDFAKGHRLVLLNNSVYDIDILHNPTGKIYNNNALDVTIDENSTVMYVWGGSVWHGAIG